MRAIMLSVAQLDERIEKCLAILADNPHSQVFAALADTYRKRGEFGRAFAVCKSGLKHHPDYAPAHIVMAKLYLHQGMHQDALNSLKHAEAQDGVTRVSEFLEAEIHIGLHDFDAAHALIERLRATDRNNPDVLELQAKLKASRVVPVKTASVDDRAPVSSDAVPATVAEPTEVAEYVDWKMWATEISKLPHVRKAFAVELSDKGTTPFSVLAEAGIGHDAADTVSICAALFASLDSQCRANGVGIVEELRIERPDGEIWCHRSSGRVIGFSGGHGLSYGALRQKALDGAARVNSSETSQ
jgi:tetratricopeptide (TPR) repeat protein